MIAFESTTFFSAKENTRSDQTFPTVRKKLDEHVLHAWDLDTLNRLQQRMSLYVHPVVVADQVHDEFAPPFGVSASQRYMAQQPELRDVYTVAFNLPQVSTRLTGNAETDDKVLVSLNSIMLLVTQE